MGSPARALALIHSVSYCHSRHQVRSAAGAAPCLDGSWHWRRGYAIIWLRLAGRQDQKNARSYVDVYICRERRRLQACEERRTRALAVAEKAAALLADAGATKVVLFGSLGRGQRFDLHSDIDLAVRGISWSEYWRLWSKVDALADIPVDLVMLDGASPSLP